MDKWQSDLLRRGSAEVAAGDDVASARIRDADAQQLAQLRTAMRAELTWALQPTDDAAADLSLESTERRRRLRARSLKKR